MAGRYEVKYESSSKGSMEIDEMNDVHLLNAYRKLQHQEGPVDQPLWLAMCSEVSRRGLDPEYRTGKPPAPFQPAPADDPLPGVDA